MNILDELVQKLESEDDAVEIVLKFRNIIFEQYSEISDLVEKELEKVARALVSVYRPVNFPYEVIPVPCIKFTKKPIIKWKDLQNYEPNSVEAIKLRRRCCRLGILINHAFILKSFVLVDLDIDVPEIDPSTGKRLSFVERRRKLNELKNEIYNRTRGIWDVESRRGFQKIFYIPNAEGVVIKYSRGEGREPCRVFWTCINIPELFAKLEVRTTRNFYCMFPEATHYLDIYNGKLIARKYKSISVEGKQFAYSSSVELLKANADDIKNFIISVLRELDEHVAKSLEKTLEVEIIDKQRFVEILRTVGSYSIVEESTKFSYSFGALTFEEFLKLIRKVRDLLPSCVRKAIFEKIPSGYCYAFARLVASFLFYIIRPEVKEVEKVAEYFSERYESFKRPKTYYWLYFAFGLRPKEDSIGFPTVFGIGKEVYEIIRELANCEKCRYKNICRYYNVYVLGKDSGLTVRQILINILQGYYK